MAEWTNTYKIRRDGRRLAIRIKSFRDDETGEQRHAVCEVNPHDGSDDAPICSDAPTLACAFRSGVAGKRVDDAVEQAQDREVRLRAEFVAKIDSVLTDVAGGSLSGRAAVAKLVGPEFSVDPKRAERLIGDVVVKPPSEPVPDEPPAMEPDVEEPEDSTEEETPENIEPA